MRSSRFALFAGALALFTLILSCTSGLIVLEGSGGVVGESRGIYNGSPPDAAHHDAVVSLHELTRKGDSVYVSPFCTATQISYDQVDGTTECEADCDGKTNGRPSGRYCYVEGVCEGPGCP